MSNVSAQIKEPRLSYNLVQVTSLSSRVKAANYHIPFNHLNGVAANCQALHYFNFFDGKHCIFILVLNDGFFFILSFF